MIMVRMDCQSGTYRLSYRRNTLDLPRLVRIPIDAGRVPWIKFDDKSRWAMSDDNDRENKNDNNGRNGRKEGRKEGNKL